MVDVEHHQTVQMAAFQHSPWALLGLAIFGLNRCLVKLIATELKRCKRLFQIVGPCQQLLVERLVLPLLLASLGLQTAQHPGVKLLIVRVLCPFYQRSFILSIHSTHYLPASVDVKGSRRFANLPPEVLFAALGHKKALSIFLICKHTILPSIHFL